MQKRIDLKSLLEKADAREVAENIGMQVVKKGSCYCVSCPGHLNRLGKVDKNLGNAVINKKGYHCFACNVSVGIINMVVEYTGCSVREAIFMVADMYGGADAFSDDEVKRIKRPSLSTRDMELIGLVNFHGRSIRNQSDVEPECSNGRYAVKKNGKYTVYYSDGWSINRLYQKDKRAYKTLVANKAKETMEKYQKLISEFCSPDAKNSYVIFELFNVNGYIPPNVFKELKIECEARYDRAKTIYQTYSNPNKDEHKKKVK